MKRLLLGTVGLVALGMAPASAADLAARPYTKAPPMVPALYDWSGFYIGVNGGWGTSHNCWTNTVVAGVPVTPAAEGCHNADGGTAGGQLGYRWEANNWVFGVEAQGNWADFSGSNVSLAAPLAPLATNRTHVDAFGLFTGQIGYAWNTTLFYVKGGGAVTDNTYRGLVAGTVVDQATSTRWGGTVGAGLEWAFYPGWSAGVEYDHLFMGSNNYNFASVAPIAGLSTRSDSIRQDVDMVTVRVNWRFGGPVIPKY